MTHVRIFLLGIDSRDLGLWALGSLIILLTIYVIMLNRLHRR